MAPARLSGGHVVSLAHPSADRVTAWLDQVPDPEIPVLSLVDLGVIRGVEWQGDTLRVTVTPTYSGCPATSVIESDIRTALHARGVEKLDLKRQISPPWTTDWMSAKGREKLEKFGISPPSPGGRPAACPHCGGTDLAQISRFGSTPCKSLWRCHDCLEPFDHFKCI